jgi:hypothetical protein
LNGLKEAQILIDEDKTYSGMKVIRARVLMITTLEAPDETWHTNVCEQRKLCV